MPPLYFCLGAASWFSTCDASASSRYADTMIAVVNKLPRQLGFLDVDDARDGATALNKMRAKRFGLVISDWNMESMTGYDSFVKCAIRD